MYEGFWIWDAPEGVDRALFFNGSGDWVISTKTLARESTANKKAAIFVTAPQATGPLDLDIFEWHEDQSVFGIQPEYKRTPTIRILPYLPKSDSDNIFDVNSVADVFGFLAKMVSSHRTSLLDLFREVDADSSGELDHDEVRVLLRLAGLDDQVDETLFHAFFDELDENGDGSITYTEFSSAIKKRMKPKAKDEEGDL
jgi:hypothetical protein